MTWPAKGGFHGPKPATLGGGKSLAMSKPIFTGVAKVKPLPSIAQPHMSSVTHSEFQKNVPVPTTKGGF